MRIPLLHSPAVALGSALVAFGLNSWLDAATRSHAGDWVGFAFFLVYGVYCTQNFLGCREVHCAFTGPGFLLAAVLMLLRISGGFDLGFGPPWLLAAAAACVGCCFEAAYARK
ncbi:MAG: hypothetical protein ACRD1L_11535 [Terriglobales bacterium]